MRKRRILICGIVLVFCLVMAWVDGVIQANYFQKSAIKLILFLVFPAIYALYDKQLAIRSLFYPKREGFRLAIPLAVGVYAVILGGYFLCKDVFDFSGITRSLTENIGVTGSNFLFVSLYISFVNSLLEEFFFRGFAFLTLQRSVGKRFAYLFSATAFTLYHIAMMIGWFSIELFLLVLAGLFIGGLLLNYLNDKGQTVYPSWLVHMFANFAINTIGFVLFGIL
ncbi:MAG: CPBP family intramembrane metalloprotease [Clostridia bacterium]|nr:CPBP family intramembrane metalloprotease [Clostridia bacterium]